MGRADTAELSVRVFGTKLRNPLILASGITSGTKDSLETAAKNGAGAVTTKSTTLLPRKGHETPVLSETPSGFINAVGITNPGIDAALSEFSGWNEAKSDVPLIFNIVGKDVEEFQAIAQKVEAAITGGTLKISALEIALSCPHTPGYGTMAGQNTPDSTEEIIRVVRSIIPDSVPLIAKLSPNISALGEVAKAAEKAGAAVINMGNSVGPGMVIDTERRSPVLSFGCGGLSGPAIRPIAVRCVYDIYKAVKIPIIGTGGVTYGKDAIEMFMAGASAVGVGTAVYYRGAKAFSLISREMEEWMSVHKVGSLSELIGVAHRK